MKELGEYLKETREANSVGVEEAAEDLKIPTTTIENIEKGNTRAFRDMLELKERVKDYAKYLGLDPEKVIDEFNDFLFEHTSKISLTDILEAEHEETKNKKDVTSPYTQIPKAWNINPKYMKIVGIVIAILVILIFLLFWLPEILTSQNVPPNRELRENSRIRGECV